MWGRDVHPQSNLTTRVHRGMLLQGGELSAEKDSIPQATLKVNLPPHLTGDIPRTGDIP